MIRYILLLVLLTVYAECATIPTEQPHDCPGENRAWFPCGDACRTPCWMQRQGHYLSCKVRCIPTNSSGACACEPDSEEVNGTCVKC
ncbi:uncharacterized protein LOC143358376 isoform X2 [Halictus rubicundus]|uniref:uncharacterized protein LOC143358376 isoform X2 n=1 Tax=Halictus rubicundus TaxID=77578 RepID=UPI0040368A7F